MVFSQANIAVHYARIFKSAVMWVHIAGMVAFYYDIGLFASFLPDFYLQRLGTSMARVREKEKNSSNTSKSEKKQLYLMVPSRAVFREASVERCRTARTQWSRSARRSC